MRVSVFAMILSLAVAAAGNGLVGHPDNRRGARRVPSSDCAAGCSAGCSAGCAAAVADAAPKERRRANASDSRACWAPCSADSSTRATCDPRWSFTGRRRRFAAIEHAKSALVPQHRQHLRSVELEELELPGRDRVSTQRHSPRPVRVGIWSLDTFRLTAGPPTPWCPAFR